MATREIITYVCDLDESEDMVEEHTITVDGTTVVADVCMKDWQKIVSCLAGLYSAGRQPVPTKVSGRGNIVDFPGQAWRFSYHALQRMGERRVSPESVVKAAEDPELVHPGGNGKSEIRIRGKVKVAVALDKKDLILTVAHRDEAMEDVA